MAFYNPLAPYKRVPFISDQIQIIGPDISASAVLMHVRVKQGDVGVPLITLLNAAVGVEGVSLTYNPAYIYKNAAGVTVTTTATTVIIRINEATIEALQLNNPYYLPLALEYDIHLTPPAQDKQLFCYGPFTIIPGVTI
jgi:hypothetical protein